MKKEILCPRCKALQKFPLLKREITDKETQLYIRCTKCRWEKVVISDHPSKIHNMKELKKLRIRAEGDPNLYRIIQRKIEKLNE